MSPSWKPAWTKKISAEMPKTISGVTSVMYTRPSIGMRAQRGIRESPSARAVPRTQAISALLMPIIRLFFSGSVIVGSARASPNHLVEKPSQLRTCRPPLNA